MKTEHLVFLGLGAGLIVLFLVPKAAPQPPPNGEGESPGANIIIEVT